MFADKKQIAEKIRKQLNIDLRNLSNWLKANKISLNACKTNF